MRSIVFSIPIPILVACGGGGASPASIDAASAIVDGTAGDGEAVVPLCHRSGLYFCEDFEALPVGPATSAEWTTESANGSLSIDTAHAVGMHALKVSTTGNGRARLQVNGLAIPNKTAWATMHAFVSGFPTAPDYAHFTLVEFSGSGDGTLLRPVGGQYVPASGSDAAGSFFGVGSDGGPTGDWTNWRREVPTTNAQETCIEFHLDGATDAVDVWIDSVARPELSIAKTMHGGADVDFVFPSLDSVWFGWWLYQPGPTPNTYDVWLDDIALGPDRLGCD